MQGSNNCSSVGTSRGRYKGGLWGLETLLQSVSYSKVSASINYFALYSYGYS